MDEQVELNMVKNTSVTCFSRNLSQRGRDFNNRPIQTIPIHKSVLPFIGVLGIMFNTFLEKSLELLSSPGKVPTDTFRT